MRLRSLTLHNVGVYRGRQTIELTPDSPDAPIILVGGLNGGGKTTFLDSLQLALYGNRARCSNRNGSSYEDFIRSTINRDTANGGSSGVELRFSVWAGGEEVEYHVIRTWEASPKSVREELSVLKNGHFDRVITEAWAEHIEELLPLEISQLFFFDGEKIEALANVQRSGELIRTAVYSLLGLDLVERLKADLSVLSRRKRTALHDPETQRRIATLRAELEQAETRKFELLQERAGLSNEISRTEGKLERLDERYRRDGGERFEQQHELENERSALQRQIASAEEQLRGLSAAEAPLLLVYDLLRSVEDRARIERDGRQHKVLLDALEARDRQLLEELSDDFDADSLERVRVKLEEDRSRRSTAETETEYLRLSEEGLANIVDLRSHRLPHTLDRLIETGNLLEDLGKRLIDIERELAAVPSSDALAPLIREREEVRLSLSELRTRSEVLDELVERAEREVEASEASLVKEIEKQVDRDFTAEANSRILLHADKAQTTLDEFRASLIAQHRASIEDAVTKAFVRLLRKETLVERVKLHPDELSVQLQDGDGRLIDPDRLSAGERQLLAVAMLWGLAEVSGRDLPTVIDTPLGRLDSVHREYLVGRYFPQASNQVILLSTDEEIDANLYAVLEPHISRTYLLDYDDQSQSTAVVESYFWPRKEVAHAG